MRTEISGQVANADLVAVADPRHDLEWRPGRISCSTDRLRVREHDLGGEPPDWIEAVRRRYHRSSRYCIEQSARSSLALVPAQIAR